MIRVDVPALHGYVVSGSLGGIPEFQILDL